MLTQERLDPVTGQYAALSSPRVLNRLQRRAACQFGDWKLSFKNSQQLRLKRLQRKLDDMSLITILNGPNLNMLGIRDPSLYGCESLFEIEDSCRRHAAVLDLEIDFRQTNYEGELVSWIQEASRKASGLILNAGAYTHTSVAVLDALLLSKLPIIEVHLSNIYVRESFRRHSYVTEAASGLIAGLGGSGYHLALTAMSDLLARKKTTLSHIGECVCKSVQEK